MTVTHFEHKLPTVSHFFATEHSSHPSACGRRSFLRASCHSDMTVTHFEHKLPIVAHFFARLLTTSSLPQDAHVQPCRAHGKRRACTLLWRRPTGTAIRLRSSTARSPYCSTTLPYRLVLLNATGSAHLRDQAHIIPLKETTPSAPPPGDAHGLRGVRGGGKSARRCQRCP